MPKFIKLTCLYTGIDYYFDIDKIMIIVKNEDEDDNGTDVIMITGAKYGVKETPEEIFSLMCKSLKKSLS